MTEANTGGMGGMSMSGTAKGGDADDTDGSGDDDDDNGDL